MVSVRGWSVKRVLALLVLGLLLPSSGALALDRGEALYENHCSSCHDDNLHERINRKARDMEELRRRVTGWAMHSGLEWTQTEINEVTLYLDRRYYNFP